MPSKAAAAKCLVATQSVALPKGSSLLGVFFKAKLLAHKCARAVLLQVVEWNDIPALEAALAPGDVACVLAEPVMTNIGENLSRPACRRHHH